MPRHNLKKWTPAQDSTAGLKTDAAERGAVCLNTKSRAIADEDGANKAKNQTGAKLGCPCGCEGEPVGEKRVFLMGHDARLRGRLIRAHLTDTPIARYQDGQFVSQHPAMDDASAYGASFVEALKGAEKRRHQANRTLLDKALNSKRLIKVGRWEHTGQVVAIYEAKGKQPKMLEIEYVTKQGQTKRVKVPESEAKLVKDQAA